jgi:peptidoglycan/xylan/chitin deacetylase (PgdA/CDA1 family)
VKLTATCFIYHLVGAGTRCRVDIDPSVVTRQLAKLRREAEVVSLATAIDQVASERARQKPLAVLTFDDAFENFHSSAWPILCDLGLPATLFVPVGFVEGETGAPMRGAEALRALDWPRIREMLGSGSLSIGSHGWTHIDLRRASGPEARREIEGSKKHLEDRLGIAVTSFSYPRSLWSRRVEALVGEHYEAAVVAGGGKLTPGGNRLRIPRVPIVRDGPEDLTRILRSRVWLREWAADKVRRYLR